MVSCYVLFLLRLFFTEEHMVHFRGREKKRSSLQLFLAQVVPISPPHRLRFGGTISETITFHADIQQLMSLIINTFHTNKEILRGPACLLRRAWQVQKKIIRDKPNSTITMEDSGVGVTKKGLVNNLATVAKSGSKACMEAMNASGNISRI